MNENREKLIKVQGIINKERFHLSIRTDLEEKAEWRLYQILNDDDKYMSRDNRAILDSDIDSIDDLISYLEKHDGFSRRF
jgi:hypothetical protein